MNKLYIYTFYRFITIGNKDKIKKQIDAVLSSKNLKGTILIANEGINGSISGEKFQIIDFLKFLRSIINVRNLNIKVNTTKLIPFKKIRVRLKKEIVSLGQGSIDVNKNRAKSIAPYEWNGLLKDPDTEIIDVRNQFEIEIGKFKNSKNPKTNSFREFPKKLEGMGLNKNKRIAIYCTGGIRCEKASAFMKLNGYKNVVQLDGGIIKYLQLIEKNESHWDGECFVFDDRVTVNKKLKQGKYIQCFGCRRPIKIKDTLSSKYKKGVTCPYCYHERTNNQINRSLSRQLQIELSKKNMKIV